MITPPSMGLRAALGLSSLLSAAVLGSGVTSCDFHRSSKHAETAKVPRLRVYAFGGPAGAIEPCGCVKDMLGGVDHAAARVLGPSPARGTLTLAAGPVFFGDPVVRESEQQQALFKAEAMAHSLKDMKLLAWAPGANDFALGEAEFSRLAGLAGAAPILSNVTYTSALARHRLVEVDGLRIGLIGVGRPTADAAPRPEIVVQDATPALLSAQAELKKAGAQMFVLLSTLPRGESLRLLEKNPGFQLAVLGKPFDAGEQNDAPFEPELVERTLVVQAPNHVQGFVAIDFFVHEQSLDFVDGSGLTELGERARMKKRLEELGVRRARARANPGSVLASDLLSLEKEIERLETALRKPLTSPIPKNKSYFRYEYVEVRESLGSNDAVRAQIDQYYRKVNQSNQLAFANKLPVPVSPGEASYIGANECKTCHAEEFAFWATTQHASAYPTLVKGNKEFNLDCVSCHVSGYEKPGGSTVTHVNGLENVQCEVCHGPGSLHRDRPSDLTLISPMPAESLCADSCHHPPHVKPDWQVREAWPHILGPGHGQPATAPAQEVRPAPSGSPLPPSSKAKPN